MTVQSPPKGQTLKIFLKRTKRRKKKRFEKPPKAAREGPKSAAEEGFFVLFLALSRFIFPLVTKKELFTAKKKKKRCHHHHHHRSLSEREEEEEEEEEDDVSELDRNEDGRVHGHLGRVDERVRVRVVRLGRRISRAETFQEDDDDDD